jgi:hypothetical protein
MLHVGWRRQSLKVCNGDFILARATANYGCSTLTPAVPGVNVLAHEWPEVAAAQMTRRERPFRRRCESIAGLEGVRLQSGQMMQVLRSNQFLAHHISPAPANAKMVRKSRLFLLHSRPWSGIFTAMKLRNHIVQSLSIPSLLTCRRYACAQETGW